MVRYAGRLVIILAAGLVAAMCIPSIGTAALDGIIGGVVKDPSGMTVAGAFVKLVNPERHLTFMVISEDQGRYSAKSLPSGRYDVQAIANGLVSKAVRANVEPGAGVTADLLLATRQGPMLPPAEPRPRGTVGDEPHLKPGPVGLPEGPGKKIVESECTQCHNLSRLVSRRANRTGWQQTIQRMRDYAETTTGISVLTDQEAQITLDYYVKNFFGDNDEGKDVDRNIRLPRATQQGAAARYRAVEYEVPLPFRGFHEMTLDSRGDVWASELGGGRLGRLDVRSLTFSEVAPPPAAKQISLNGMTRGQGDEIWTMDPRNRRLLRFNTKAGTFKVFIVPKLKWGSPMSNSMQAEPNGDLWLTGVQSSVVMHLNPATEKFTVYDVPSSGARTVDEGLYSKKRASPTGMAIAGDGTIWFAEDTFDMMGRLTPATGKVELFPIPWKGEGRSDPRKVTSDADGNVWVAFHGAGKVMKVDYKTTKMTIFTPPTANPGGYGIAGDVRNNVIWFAEIWVDKLARFDIKTGTFVEYPMPNAETDMRTLQVDPQNPNRVWYVGMNSNRIGYLEVLN